jgi:hypothetical protein
LAALNDIARRRLHNQRLLAPLGSDPADVVRFLGAVQSQDYAGAKWALGMRTRGVTDADVERAFSEGAILRTHVLRPTWHFVTPADIRWMLALTAPRVKAAMAYYDRKLELDDAVFQRSNAAIERALRDGKQLSRQELGNALRAARIDVTGGQRLGHLMLRAELEALVCSGARRGKQFTYALLEERVPPARSLERDEALLELTRRYFAARGPATAKDFAWWSGLTVSDAKRGIEIAGGVLQRETIDDRAYWSGAATVSPATRRSPVAHLLPNYDEYFIGFRDRSAIGERLKSSELVTGGDALVAHVVLVDGQLVGGWRRIIAKDQAVIGLRLITRLSSSEKRAIARAAQAYRSFLGVTVQLRRLSARRRGQKE